MPLVLPKRPWTWTRLLPYRVLQLLCRIRGRRPPSIAQMAADPEECELIVDEALRAVKVRESAQLSRPPQRRSA